MKTLSVIVPAYNVEKYIGKCLDSLVTQTLDNIEIIVVNDSSTDSTQEIVDTYVEKYPTLIFSYIKPNGGIADVRNFALTKVNGEYFGFLDSDDFAEKEMYESLYLKAKEEDSDIVSSNFFWEYPNKTLIGLDGPYGGTKDMLVKTMATLWSKIYRTEFVKKLNITFPTGYRYEDVYFLYCLAPYTDKVSYVPGPFVHYVQRGGSITHANDSRVKDMIHVFGEIEWFYRDRELFEVYKDELEYLYARFFLGNSLLRALQIDDKQFRNNLIDETWELLNKLFPDWKRNCYIQKESNLKKIYYKVMSRSFLKFVAPILRIYINGKQKELYD